MKEKYDLRLYSKRDLADIILNISQNGSAVITMNPQNMWGICGWMQETQIVGMLGLLKYKYDDELTPYEITVEENKETDHDAR